MTLTPSTAKELVEAAKEVFVDINSMPYLLRPHGKNCEMMMSTTECQCLCGAAQRNNETIARLRTLRTALSKAEREMEGGG